MRFVLTSGPRFYLQVYLLGVHLSVVQSGFHRMERIIWRGGVSTRMNRRSPVALLLMKADAGWYSLAGGRAS